LAGLDRTVIRVTARAFGGRVDRETPPRRRRSRRAGLSARGIFPAGEADPARPAPASAARASPSAAARDRGVTR